MKIEELTESSLVLSIKDQQNVSQSGFKVAVDIDAILYFKRQ